jgi:hypothetical protein
MSKTAQNEAQKVHCSCGEFMTRNFCSGTSPMSANIVRTALRAPFTALLLLTVFAAAAHAETFTYDFQTGFDGWQQQWHKESETGTDGVVSHSTERGFNDNASLHFDMGDGFGDDGTLWIERQFDLIPNVPTLVDLSFQLFNEFHSDFNTFQVKAAISTQNPAEQADFTTIGSTDSAEGWVPFDYSDTITSPTGQVWVALGIRVAWETHRDYWIDHVTVTTTPIPEPATAGLLMLLPFARLLRRHPRFRQNFRCFYLPSDRPAGKLTSTWPKLAPGRRARCDAAGVHF